MSLDGNIRDQKNPIFSQSSNDSNLHSKWKSEGFLWIGRRKIVVSTNEDKTQFEVLTIKQSAFQRLFANFLGISRETKTQKNYQINNDFERDEFGKIFEKMRPIFDGNEQKIINENSIPKKGSLERMRSISETVLQHFNPQSQASPLSKRQIEPIIQETQETQKKIEKTDEMIKTHPRPKSRNSEVEVNVKSSKADLPSNKKIHTPSQPLPKSRKPEEIVTAHDINSKSPKADLLSKNSASLNEEEVQKAKEPTFKRKIYSTVTVSAPFFNSKPIVSDNKISDEFFGHILGDTFLAESGLEGGKIKEFAIYVKKLLETEIGIEDKDSLLPSIKMIESLIENSKLIDSIPRFQTQLSFYEKKRILEAIKVAINDISASISNQIKQLNDGEQLILPGGWSGSPGHAMIYVIRKDGENNYSFTCINTGAGLNYHQSREINNKTKFNEFYTIFDITAENISSPEIFKHFYRLMVPYTDDGAYQYHNEEDIYEKILPLFHGIAGNDTKDNDRFITVQRSGTCAWKVVTSLLSLEMEKSFYKQVMLEIKLQTLKTWTEQESVRPIKGIKQQLMNLSCEALARNAIQGHKENHISAEQLINVENVISECKQKLSNEKREPFSPGDDSKYLVRLNNKMLSNSIIPLEKSHPIRSSSTEALSYLETLNQHNLDERVGDFIAAIKRNIQADFPPEIIVMTISAFVADLVLKVDSNDFFTSSVAQKVIDSTAMHLEALEKLHLQQLSLLPKFKMLTPDSYATSICITNLILQLAKQDPVLASVFSEKSSSDQWFKNSNDRYFWVADPNLRRALEASLKTLEKIESFSSIKISSIKKHATISRLIEHSYFDDKIEGWSSLTNELKLSKLLKNQELFPPAFIAFLRTYYIASWHGNPSFPLNFEGDIEVTFQRNYEEDPYDPHLNGREITFYLNDAWKGNHFEFQQKGMEELIGNPSYMSGSYFEDWNKNNSLANEASVLGQVKSLSKEATRPLAFINSNIEVSIPQMLGYFVEHPSKLEEKDYQWFFLSHIFHSNAFENKLSESDALKTVWKDFLSKQLKLAKANNHIEQILFITYLKRVMPASVIEGKQEAFEALQEMIRLEKSLDPTNPDTRQLRGVIAGHKMSALAQLNEKSPKIAEMIAVENLLYQTYARKDHFFLCQENEIAFAIEDFFVPFSGQLNTSNIVEEIRDYFDVSAETPWKRSNSILVNKNKVGQSVEIDVIKGIVKVGSNVFGDTSNVKLIMNEDFIRIFEGKTYELFLNSSSSTSQQFQCHVLDPEKQVTNSYEIYWNGKEAIITTEYDRKKWELVTFKELQHSLPNHAVLQGVMNFWRDGEKIEVRTKSGELYAQVGQDGFIKRVNPGGFDDGAVLFQSRSPPSHIKRFAFSMKVGGSAQTPWVLNWGGKVFELPNLGMKFTKTSDDDDWTNSQDTYVWSENPAYQIAGDQTLNKTLPDLENYLILENGDGQKIILIPKAKIEPKKTTGSLDTSFKFVQKQENIGCYALKISPDGLIRGENLEENLFLAYLHIAQKNYVQARYYLEQKRINPLKEFGPEQLETIHSMLTHIKESKDQRPEAIALQLHILARLKYNGSANSLPVLSLVDKYRDLESHMSMTSLSDDDKRILGFPVREIQRSVAATNKSIPLEPFKLPSLINQLSEKGIEIKETINSQVIPDKKLLSIFEEKKDMTTSQKREFKRMREEIIKNCETESNEKIYSLKGSVDQAKEQIQFLYKSHETKIENLEKEILSLANKKPEDPLEKVVHNLSLTGRKLKVLSIDDLIILAMQNHLEGLTKQNPALTHDEKLKLMHLVSQFVGMANQQQKLKRVNDKLEQIQGQAKEVHAEQKLIHEAISELMNDSLIKPEEFEMHVFSYYAEITFRPYQIDMIRELRIDPNKETISQVYQLLMGSGKSKVIMPLLALLNSTGKNIPVFMVPDSLFETNSPDLKYSSGEYLSQEIETCYFRQEHHITLNDLLKLKGQLERVRKNRSYILTTPWSMHLLQLHYQSARDALRADPSQKVIYDLISQILEDFKAHGNLLCDEFDTVMDVSLEANRPIGRDSQPTMQISQLYEDFFVEINQNPALAEKLKVFKNVEAALSKEEYEELKPQLATIFLKLLQAQGLQVHGQEQNWINYLCEKSPDSMSRELSPKLKSLVGCAKGMLNTFFYNSLRENPLQHYGLSQKTLCPFAIPYDSESRKPKEGSEFSSHFETIIRTYLNYSKDGVPRKLIEHVVNECVAQAHRELLKKVEDGELEQNIELRSTNAYEKFNENALFGKLGYALDKISPSVIDQISKQINDDPKLRLQFAKQYAIPWIKYYSEKISSNPYTISAGMFSTTSGFTGTLANQDTYHPSIKRDTNAGVDGKSLNLIAKKSMVVQIPESKESSVLPLFIKLIDGNYHALIDAGAWFRGVPNHQVAADLMSHLTENGSPLKGIVFINDRDIPPGSKGTFVIIEPGRNIPKLLKDSTLKPEERFTYYHLGTGLDMPQAKNAKALLTESQNTSRELFQGAWRMRGFAEGQSVDLAIPPSIEGATVDTMLLSHAIEQANRQEQQIVQSTYMLIDFTIKQFINEKIKGFRFFEEKEKVFYDKVRPLLIDKLEDDPWALFAQISDFAAANKVLDNYISQKINVLKDALSESDRESLKTLNSQLEQCVRKELLPLQLKQKKVDVNTTQQSQQQTQAQSQVDVDLTSTINQKKIVSNNITRSWFAHNPGPKVSLFSVEFFSKTNLKLNTLQDYLDAVASEVREVDSVKTFFSSNVNFTPNYRADEFVDLGKENQIVFGDGTKPATLSLLTRNKKNGQIGLIYLAPDEAALMWRIMKIDNNEATTTDKAAVDYDWKNNWQEIERQEIQWKKVLTASNRDIQIALYNPQLGIVQEGKDKMDWNQLKQDPQMVALAVETKFWNGCLNYNKEDTEYLEKWIDRVGPENFENMMTKNILRYRPEALANYPQSVLAKLVGERKSQSINDVK